jgi:CRISPR-associated protein Csm4
MEALLLRCRDGVQFHLGERSLEDTSELVHADTIFSALANVYALAYDAAAEWVNHIQDGRIHISSAMHCLELSWRPEPVFFVPRPPFRYGGAAAEPTAAKRIRRIRYVSAGLLAEIRSAVIPASDPEEVPVCALDLLAFPVIGERYACTEAELAPLKPGEVPQLPLTETVMLPRVQVRTPTVEDNYYHAAGFTFVPPVLEGGRRIRGHFYVLVEHTLDPGDWERFLACLRLLADEGIGGERSAGYGWFQDVELLPSPFPVAWPGGGMNLSLAPVVPSDDEEFGRAVHYELFVRGGGSLGERGDARAHRRRVRMMREGALFLGPVRGRLVDVSPELNPRPHSLLRCGLNFPLPLGPIS